MVEPPTNWFVGFLGRPIQRPWKWFCRPGFTHCFALYFMAEYEMWWFIEWSSYRLYIEPMHGEQVDALFYTLRTEGTLVQISSENLPPRINNGTVPIYCVSWIKQLIGLRGFIATPYQLFCALKRAGGTVIFEQEGDANGKSVQERTKAPA